MALDLDKRVLCFDGSIPAGMDISSASALEANGLFVVRSSGGDATAASPWPTCCATGMQASSPTATVSPPVPVFLLVASDQAFVMRDTRVAWHHISLPFCPSLEASKDGGPKRLEKAPCSDTPGEYQSGYQELEDMKAAFYQTRIVDPLFEDPPKVSRSERC